MKNIILIILLSIQGSLFFASESSSGSFDAAIHNLGIEVLSLFDLVKKDSQEVQEVSISRTVTQRNFDLVASQTLDGKGTSSKPFPSPALVRTSSLPTGSSRFVVEKPIFASSMHELPHISPRSQEIRDKYDNSACCVLM